MATSRLRIGLTARRQILGLIPPVSEFERSRGFKRPLPPEDDAYSARWQAVKSAFSAAMPPTERRSAARVRNGERGILQRRFWKHTIRDDRDYAAHVDYVHFNPVKHGLVAWAADWPYS